MPDWATKRMDAGMKSLMIAGLIGLMATAAVAHSPLDATTPADKAIVAVMPDQVLMDFKGDMRLTRVTITHADTHSMNMEIGTQTAFAQEFALPMHDMGAGFYVVEWRGLGADGHPMNGTFSFEVE